MNIKKLMKASTTAEEINQLDKDIIKIEALAEKVAQGLLVNNLKFDFSENPSKEDPEEDYEKLIKGIFEERLRGVFQIKSTSLEGDNKKEPSNTLEFKGISDSLMLKFLALAINEKINYREHLLQQLQNQGINI